MGRTADIAVAGSILALGLGVGTAIAGPGGVFPAFFSEVFTAGAAGLAAHWATSHKPAPIPNGPTPPVQDSDSAVVTKWALVGGAASLVFGDAALVAGLGMDVITFAYGKILKRAAGDSKFGQLASDAFLAAGALATVVLSGVLARDTWDNGALRRFITNPIWSGLANHFGDSGNNAVDFVVDNMKRVVDGSENIDSAISNAITSHPGALAVAAVVGVAAAGLIAVGKRGQFRKAEESVTTRSTARPKESSALKGVAVVGATLALIGAGVFGAYKVGTSNDDFEPAHPPPVSHEQPIKNTPQPVTQPDPAPVAPQPQVDPAPISAQPPQPPGGFVYPDPASTTLAAAQTAGEMCTPARVFVNPPTELERQYGADGNWPLDKRKYVVLAQTGNPVTIINTNADGDKQITVATRNGIVTGWVRNKEAAVTCTVK